ncbi:replication endonuclease [Vibrio astriarenae]
MMKLIKPVEQELNQRVSARQLRKNATPLNVANFRDEQRAKLASIQSHIKNQYPDLFGESALLTHDKLISQSRLKSLSNAAAESGLKLMQEITTHHQNEFADFYETIRYVVGEQNKRARALLIEPPIDLGAKQPPTEGELESAALKLVDPSWYMRRLMKLRGQYKEYCQIALGYVGEQKHQHKYVSRGAFNAWKENQRQMQEYIKNMALLDEENGESISLEDAINSSTANPENRRVEMMVRARGFEELAEEKGYTALFITWTLPSRFHRNSYKWDGSSPLDGQAELMKTWARGRARLAKRDIDYFGFRVAEPHKDATPHAHYFLFCAPRDVETIKAQLQDAACKTDREELGDNTEARFKAVECDPSKGGATAYIAKYVSKNINGAYLAEDENGQPLELAEAEKSAFSVRAWASLFNIRQFQQFGGASVSLWRVMRKAKPSQTQFNEQLEAIRQAADSSKWSVFCELAQGVKLAYEKKDNQYKETIKRVIGFEWVSGVIQTARECGLKLVPKAKAEGLLKARSASTWSTENNCNHAIREQIKTVTGWSSAQLTEYVSPLLKGRIFIVDQYQTIKIRNGRLLVSN